MNTRTSDISLKGKVAIVTGANSGTGYGITYHLANRGCKVIMASRNEAKLEEAGIALKKEVPNAELELEILDLTSLSSIKNFTSRVTERYQKIDFLANNAGGGSSKYLKTEDGFEANFCVNYLGHFALTTQLLPLLKDSSRIVNFSSIGYKKFLKHDLDINNLEAKDAGSYNQMQEYCRAKLCSILHSVKLNQEFEKIGSTSKALACHPGWARTNLMNKEGEPVLLRFVFNYIVTPLSKLFGLSQSLYDGALPAVEALTTDTPEPNKVYAPGNKNESTGTPKTWDIDRTHFKEQDIDLLWNKTQEMLRLSVDEYLKA